MRLRADAIPAQIQDAEERSILAIDCRGADRATAERIVHSLCPVVGSNCCIVAISTRYENRLLDILTTVGPMVTAAILSEGEQVGFMLRMILNDPFGHIATAIAYQVVAEVVPDDVHRILLEVLAGGMHVTSVGQLATALQRSRSAMDRQSTRSHAPAPTDVLALAKASYAVVMARSTAVTLGALAHVVGFSKGASLAALIERTFSRTFEQVRTASPEMSPEVYLRSLWAP